MIPTCIHWYHINHLQALLIFVKTIYAQVVSQA